MNTELRPLFPFTALLGQPALQHALSLIAVDPQIGGLLIEGPRGTAKSTSARAIAELLPSGSFVTLPLGASEEQLIGSLDIEAALRGGEVRFSPGLLWRADGGVLYVDEVNLLPDVLVDQLLDVAASGVNIIERDGISHQHRSSFVLVGTMNGEEGELRPQLLDRFGLALRLHNPEDAAVRRDIVKARLAFDLDPLGFRDSFAARQAALAQQLRAARERLAQITISDTAHDRISELCMAAGVDGMRADLVMARTARAHAALQGNELVLPMHVESIAELALWHRRRDSPPARGQQHASSNDQQRSEIQPSASAASWGELAAPPLDAIPVRPVRLMPQKKSQLGNPE